MPQAYGLITDGINCLIPKKAIENDLWGGQKSTYGSVLVNQPGQYALFGGRVEVGDVQAHDAAMREIYEESGVDLNAMKPSFYEITGNTDYACYAVLVSSAQLLELQREMSHHINTRSVIDGEMQSVTTVPLTNVSQYLGVDQAPVLTSQQKVKYDKGEVKKPGRHKIDWYKEIAIATDKNRAVIQAHSIDRGEGSRSSSVSSAPGGEDMVRKTDVQDVQSEPLAVITMSPDGEIPDIVMKRKASIEQLTDGVIRCLQEQVVPHQGDIQTRDKVVEVMAEVLIEDLSKDKDAMAMALSQPSALYRVINNPKGPLGSAKMDRFLEQHHNNPGDVKKAFKEEKYKIAKKSYFEALFTTKKKDQPRNISSYVAGEISKEFKKSVPVAHGREESVRLVDKLLGPEGGEVVSSNSVRHVQTKPCPKQGASRKV